MPAGGRAQETIAFPAQDRPLALRPVDLFTVGIAEGAPHEMFARVMSVAFDAADNLYVLDSGNHRIVVFGPDGRHIRTFGRQGGGPGEFNLPQSLAVLTNGELVVSDAMRADVQRFGRDGALLGSFALGELRPAGRIQASPRGGFVSVGSAMPTRFEGAPPPHVDQLHWLRGGDAPSQPLFTTQPRVQNSVELSGASGGGNRMVMMMPTSSTRSTARTWARSRTSPCPRRSAGPAVPHGSSATSSTCSASLSGRSPTRRASGRQRVAPRTGAVSPPPPAVADPRTLPQPAPLTARGDG
jgi:hypothetical protein